jgi:hypothetical protein
VVGYGDAPKKIPHRAASCPTLRTQECNLNNAYYSPGPNPNIHYGALVGGPDLLDDFSDQRDESNPQNRVGLLNNAGFVGAVAGIRAKYISVSKCEQGQGFINKMVHSDSSA